LGGGGAAQNANVEAVNTALGAARGFDPEAFTKGIVDSARVNLEQDTQGGINAFNSAIGGNESTNTIAALVADRARRDQASTLGGIASGAAGQAAQISTQLLDSVLNAARAAGVEPIVAIGNLLKGGVASSTGQAASQQQQAQQTAQAGTATTAEQTQTIQQQQTAELVNEIVNQLLAAEGTSTTKSKGKNSSLGFSAEIPFSL